MGLIITDGQGQGYAAGVSRENQLLTLAASESLVEVVARSRSDAYLFTTDVIALTSGVSALLRIRNDAGRDFVVEGVRFSSSITATFRLMRNVTTGTIVSGGTVTQPPNTNFGSAKQFEGEYRIGADAVTATDGDLIEQAINQNAGPVSLSEVGELVLPANTSLVVTAEVGAGGNASATVLGYYPSLA